MVLKYGECVFASGLWTEFIVESSCSTMIQNNTEQVQYKRTIFTLY